MKKLSLVIVFLLVSWNSVFASEAPTITLKVYRDSNLNNVVDSNEGLETETVYFTWYTNNYTDRECVFNAPNQRTSIQTVRQSTITYVSPAPCNWFVFHDRTQHGLFDYFVLGHTDVIFDVAYSTFLTFLPYVN